MAMRLTLDRPALHALIDRDSEFELRLQDAVLTEVGRRVLTKDANKFIAAAQPALFAKCLKGLQDDEDLTKLIAEALQQSLVVRDNNWSHTARLSDDMKKRVNEAVSAIKDCVVSDAVSTVATTLTPLVNKKLAEVLAADDLDSRIEKRVARLLDDEIKRRVDAKFKERLAALSQT